MSSKEELNDKVVDRDQRLDNGKDDTNEQREDTAIEFSEVFMESNREMLRRLKEQHELEDMINELRVHLFNTPVVSLGQLADRGSKEDVQAGNKFSKESQTAINYLLTELLVTYEGGSEKDRVLQNALPCADSDLVGPYKPSSMLSSSKFMIRIAQETLLKN